VLEAPALQQPVRLICDVSMSAIGAVRVFRWKFTLEDAIEFHTFAPIEAAIRVTNDIPLGWPLSDRIAM
jgi:hypothetical protein